MDDTCSDASACMQNTRIRTQATHLRGIPLDCLASRYIIGKKIFLAKYLNISSCILKNTETLAVLESLQVCRSYNLLNAPSTRGDVIAKVKSENKSILVLMNSNLFSVEIPAQCQWFTAFTLTLS